MRISPKEIARALIDTVEADPSGADDACDAALAYLHTACPGFPRRTFLQIAEREMKKRGDITPGMLMVPSEKSVKTETIAALLSKKSEKPVALERKISPDLIGGAVLLVGHVRIDSSVKGALAELLKTCLQPLD